MVVITQSGHYGQFLPEKSGILEKSPSYPFVTIEIYGCRLLTGTHYIVVEGFIITIEIKGQPRRIFLIFILSEYRLKNIVRKNSLLTGLIITGAII